MFTGVDEDIRRTKSGADLAQVLNHNEEWLVCSLIHKFGVGDEMSEEDVDTFVSDLRKNLPKDFRAKGEFFVFVDECHRTQSGTLHDAMKALLPGAMLIGFTGTPLLKRDKKKSIEVFGPYIHTYKYDEAVRDGVVLDLRYEARDIDQRITSQHKVDQWFQAKTKGLSDLGKAQLKQRWGTMKRVLSSRERLQGIVADILMDMGTRDRLQSGRGNAILVSDSIYAACRLYEMFQDTELAGKCAIVTSYKPHHSDIKGEESGEGQTEKLLKYDVYRKMLAEHFGLPEDEAAGKVETFELEIKKRFIDHPGQMKLLIVVDKLLTGFDAPSATYLYIDKQMRDHGLFQAICRVNRLDGDDKEYGYVIDYKDLFKSLEKSITDYTGEAFDAYDSEDVDGLLKDRIREGRERLEEVLEAIRALCEPVPMPKDSSAHRHYFCAVESGNAEQLKENEPKRITLYKLTAALVRAYANLVNEMTEAGYSDAEAADIKAEVGHFEKLREEIKLASGDHVDMKLYEPAMRHLLDTYIRAEESKVISQFDDLSLIDLVVAKGPEAVNDLPEGLQDNQEAVAETIENNVRKLIIDESPVNPRYYQEMSELLDALIEQRKKEALAYKEYLAKIVELTKKAKSGGQQPAKYEYDLDTPAKRALFDNLKGKVSADDLRPMADVVAEAPDDWARHAAKAVDNAVRAVKKDNWRGMRAKQIEVRNAIKSVFTDDHPLVGELYAIIEKRHDY